jgi:hypothetical protein
VSMTQDVYFGLKGVQTGAAQVMEAIAPPK